MTNEMLVERIRLYENISSIGSELMKKLSQ